MTKRILIAGGLLLTLLIALGQSQRINLGFVDALERQAYDLRVRLSSSSERDPRVVIIDVDEQSLLEQGQFPWPRALMAELVDKLFDDYQIDTLGFDALFAEPENSFSLAQVRQALTSDEIGLAELEKQTGDVRFAQAIEGRSVVLGIVFESAANPDDIAASVGVLPEPVFSADPDINAKLAAETGAPVALRYSANIPLLQNAAQNAGFISILVQDPDGIIRRVGMLNEFDGKLYSSLSLELVKTYFQDLPEPLLVDNPDDQYDGLEGIRMLHEDIPLDAEGGIYVPYSVPGQGYEYVSATGILTGEYKGDISGAIAIFGTSSAGLVDRRNTPVMPGLPGVEVHANLVSALLDGNFRTRPNWVNAADLLILAGLGVLLSLALPYLSAALSSGLYLLGVGSTIALNWYFWSEQQLILAVAPALFLATLIYIANVVVGFFAESRARLATQKMFGLYVPPEVVSEISDSADLSSLKSERRVMTVLFADIRDFTSVAEEMPPVELSKWLNDFLTPMTTIIHKHGGAIDKYMGDAVMAFWGAPIEDPKHAENAMSAALEMLEYLQELNRRFAEEGRPTARIGLGVNTGLMAVGNMGSEFRMAYTVVGDAVNLGARLEELTKEYKQPLVVSEFTADQAPGFNYRRLDRLKVKGKQQAVTIYTCNGKAGQNK